MNAMTCIRWLDSGKPDVTEVGPPHLRSDNSVQVSVRDAGVGLADVDVSKMFALSYTTKPAGSGVGPAISRSIIDAHGGELWAEPNAETGARFRSPCRASRLTPHVPADARDNSPEFVYPRWHVGLNTKSREGGVMSNKRILVMLCFAIVATVAAACANRSGSAAPPNTTAVAGRMGEFVWQDLITDNIATSRTFYEQLFGWQFEQTTRSGRPYLLARLKTNPTPIAGMVQVARRRPDEPITQWLSYLAVADVDAMSTRLTGAGAQVLVAPTDVQTSRAAVAVDPQGAPFGLVTLGSDVRLPVGGQSAEVGTFFWRDYLAKDVDGARYFLRRPCRTWRDETDPA